MMDDCAAYYMDCPYCTDKCVCMAAEEAQKQKSEPISEKKCSETDDALETGDDALETGDDAQHFTQTTTRRDR